jgi:hypothetical protein
VSDGDSERPSPGALLEDLSRGATDWNDARIPALLAWLRAGQRRSELQAVLRSSRLGTLPPARATELTRLLSDLGMLELAFAVSAQPALRGDPELAAQRARLAMQRRDYPEAIAASELAIGALLQQGLSVAEFLRLCTAGAPAEGMLRFERHVLAERAHLRERLALRWEALHRAGRTRDAHEMQLMCQRYFPERASVWATAGNHALDADDLVAAEGYFEHCLKLDASWTAAVAGLAIVWERRKNWPRALPYRQRVVELEHALQRDDAASLQRKLRYAAALARLGRWRDAEPLFRSAVRARALAQLPAERPVLLKVFSQELYAPALVDALLQAQPTMSLGTPSSPPPAARQATTASEPAAGRPQLAAADQQSAAALRTQPTATSASDLAAARPPLDASSAQLHRQRAADRSNGADLRTSVASALPAAPRAVGAGLSSALQEPAVVLAQHEAELFVQLRLHLTAAAMSEPERRWALALCAFLSGELEQAYELLDQVEVDRPEDIAVHCLLLRSALAIGHAQRASIRAFAEGAARVLWDARQSATSEQLGYAVAILPELAKSHDYTAPEAVEELEPRAGPLLEQLERLAAFRAVQQAAGRSPLIAAAASTHALAALCEAQP